LATDKAQKPHILLLMPDQLRADYLGVSGHPAVKTPSIDRLAGEGVRFTHAFTNSPLCGPMRHSLARGLYPHNSHCWMDPEVMRGDEDTYMKRVQQAGYRTGMIGKCHFHWEDGGVDLKSYEGFLHSLGYDDVFETGGSWSNTGTDTIFVDDLKKHGLEETRSDYYRKLEALPDEQRRFLAEASPLAQEHVLDSFIGRSAVNYIETYDDARPSCLFVGFQGPHEPWDPPQPYASMYDPDDMPDPIEELPFGDWLPDHSRKYHRYAQYFQPDDPHKIKEVRANYCGKISLIDHWIGEILAAYGKKGWLDNTVILFYSDHGDALGDHNRISKSMFFDGMVRIPIIIRLPGAEHGGKVLDSLVETIDLYPTLLELGQCERPRYNDGLSLVPLIRGEVEALRDDVLGEVHAHSMIRTRDWKLVLDNRSGESLQLFDLTADPCEQTNLIGHPDCREIEARMRDRLLRRVMASQRIISRRDPTFSAHVPEGSEV